MGQIMCFQILLTNGERLWPATIFPVWHEDMPLTDLQMVHTALERDGRIIVAVIAYDSHGERMEDHSQVFSKEELAVIQGPIPTFPPCGISVNEVFGLSEAARLWGIEGGGATIRKALERGEFSPSEIRKSDGILLVTFSGMQRRYNAIMKHEWMETQSYFVQEGVIRVQPEISPTSQHISLTTLTRRHRKASDI
ncbi:helix-turn-helix domain-containing protein [Paenibacillus taiwanensis]|uniref:helix-turn-helix domain-containing protein n=1 Tax=Paenibacillus taiwanensis TaxID=401638 RepID=UPI0003F4C59C|nr:helix-turn-helix domain-containing protein [Paenibacillus taiwanensis]